MTETFDVPSRLAEGRPAVENLQHYVWACHRLGYQHPDLTLHARQLLDWYGSEDGMDLAVLQGDWLALEAAARASQDALAVQDRQLSLLAAAWQGTAAQASGDFLRRHREASAAVASAVRTAAEALAALRESLWQAVDTKTAAAVTVEGSAQAQRPDWLAAAATVTTGAGDQQAAAELVDQAVKPFVDNSVRSEWLTTTRAMTSSVVDAYRRAAAEISAEYQPLFEVPGDLGPTSSPAPARCCDDEVRCEDEGSPAVLAGPAVGTATVPAAWSAPPAPAAVPSAAVEPAAVAPETLVAPEAPEAPVAPAVPPMPQMPPLGGMGSSMPGMPDLGGGLSGLGQQFADALGGLLGAADGPIPDQPDLEVPGLDDPLDDTEEVTEEEVTEEEVTEEEPNQDPGMAADPAPQDCEDPAAVPAEPAPAPTPAPPPAEPLPPVDLPPAEPLAAEQTPCAIAADELPQVGEPPG